jgi:hypothetical protein
MILGYGSESSPMWESVVANAFLAALNDPVLALEVRKRNIATLDGAYREAALLEGFSKASTRQETTRRVQVRAIGAVNASTTGKIRVQYRMQFSKCTPDRQHLHNSLRKHSKWSAKCKPCYSKSFAAMDIVNRSHILPQVHNIVWLGVMNLVAAIVSTAMNPDITPVRVPIGKKALHPQLLKYHTSLANTGPTLVQLLEGCKAPPLLTCQRRFVGSHAGHC